MTEKHILQRLYDSEIDWSIHSRWDEGFSWWVGDSMLKQGDHTDTFEQAVEAVRQAAITLYPNSDFAIQESQN